MVDFVRMMAVARKEVLQFRRDPRSLLLAFISPLLLVVLFGYAITWDVTRVPLAIVDQDHTAASRALLEAFLSSDRFVLEARLLRTAEVAPLFERSRAQMALVVPPGFARKLGAGIPAPLQLLVDGSDANTATISIGYAQAIIQSYSAAAVPQVRRMALPVSPQERIWYNEDLRSRNMIVPGLVAVIMMIIAAMLTSLTIAREWERGTMEQLASTPVSRFEIVIGKLLPYLAIGMVDVATTSALGVLLFHVPFHGDPLLLGLLSLAFLVGSLGLGIFVSAVAKSQVLATQMAMLITFLPAFLLSGFMFGVEVMPAPLRALTFIVPARYFLVVTRGIFLKGVGLDVLAVQGLFMLAFAALGLSLALRVFRKELTS